MDGKSVLAFGGRDDHRDLLRGHDRVNAREARTNFKDFIAGARYQERRIVVTEHGKPAAALVTLNDLRMLDVLSKNGVRDADAVEKMMTSRQGDAAPNS